MTIYGDRILVDWEISGEAPPVFDGLAPFFVLGFVLSVTPVCFVPVILNLMERTCQL